MRFVEHARQYESERERELRDQFGDDELGRALLDSFLNKDAANDDREALSEGMAREVAQEVRRETQVDVTRARVKNLAGDIAGLYTYGSQAIEVDRETAESGDREIVKHVLLHEANHARNDRERIKRGEERLVNSDWEEALTESKTAEVTGEVRAYHDLVGQVDRVASEVGESRSRLLEWFANGENTKLNVAYEQTYGGVRKAA